VNEGMEAALILEASRRIELGWVVDDVIQFLRDSGVDASDSIWILVKTGRLTPKEAKHAAINSPAWTDIRGPIAALREMVISEVMRNAEK
jgi:hypothetical protein